MNLLLHKLKQKIRGLSISVMRFVIKQPQLKDIALFILTKVPKVKANLNNIALSGGLSTKQHSEVTISEFNNELGNVSIGNISASKVTDLNYFESDIPQKLCQVYGLNFDFDLIEKIRQGQQINYTVYSGEKIKLSIAHFYLALLFRFPSTTEIKQCFDLVRKKNSFEPLIKMIMDSPEYIERGYKKVIL